MIHLFFLASAITLITFPIVDVAHEQESVPSKHQGEGRSHEPKYGFSFKPPPGWKSKKSDDPKVMMEYMGPINNDFITNLNIRRIAYSGKTLNAIGDSIEAARKKLQKYQLIERKEITIEDSKVLLSIIQFSTMINDRELEVRSMQYFIISTNKKNAFFVTFTTLPDQFVSLRKEFEECAKSIKTD